ncbi:Cas10/Cmr2 second palm domain-containing protein [Nocardia farcinica]|uniref:Cas10/Cmr2 second palm domain-containing protein n=3 Tax=Nocardiaceae TaxID=85025 RepID=UPI0018948A32|nr:hypothetical protein [Nocardia farcinica]MBF6294624.1 hypothetical protein [Nocardia farcinica]MBF6381796.1 hypothetical protein [Nocardia farcinica]UEX20817.1 hypothetical protein LMJ57_17475 [Nocardia farcinica]
MTFYLDISVVQIQRWLAQAATLKGRRGASSMIRLATEPDRIRALLAGHGDSVGINTEQGFIDGVVSLIVAENSGAVAVVEQRILAHLRTAMPTATLRVIRSSGPSYGSRVPESTVDWPAATAEWPLGRPCAWCRRYSATEMSGGDADSEPVALCVDCRSRRSHAGSAQSPKAIPGPERDLIARLDDQRPVPDNFEALARLGLGRARDNTHIALIYADANALGRFIKSIAASAPTLLPQLPAVIHDATWAAVVAGVAAIDTGQSSVPVIAHLVGGDDIVVSVPAHGMWDFTAAMTEAFTATVGELLAQVVASVPVGAGEAVNSEVVAGSAVGVRDRISAPTLSAGVVVHHESFPFSTVIDLAADLLRRAKVAAPGRAVVCWQSVTHEGDQPSTRPPVPAAALRENGDALAGLAALPASQRQELSWLLREPDASTADLDIQLRRMGLRATAAPFLPERNRSEAGIGLADALDMVRWWRA